MAQSDVFIIAEAGVNHNGDMDLARRLIDVAAEAGADAVKFQTFTSASLMSDAAPMAEYQKAGAEADSAVEMIRALELGHDQFAELARHCEQRGILFLSTAFDIDSARFLHGLGMRRFKIPSGEITNAPLIRRIARMADQVIVSTGMATLADVEAAVGWIEAEGVEDIVILHCVSNYPAPPEAANLRAMDTLRAAFGHPVGWSDHTLGDAVTLAAVARGATVIEKHFTLDTALPGPDHAMSLNPDELRAMVARIRDVEASLGSGRKAPTEAERETAVVARRSLFARVAIAAGQTVTEEELIALRPGDGLSPARLDDIVGRPAARDIAAGAKLGWNDLA
ncbi:N-acetylneuraminate synthase [Brevundimonas lutea]|uniref:N-acetylneuraminate synthase n=1 Tax=Brevundimonas lutea TaxID=2293980 RepID=UPI000F020409|nr:N-acetylneuraminate synthase [Brevundimonas lutea]